MKKICLAICRAASLAWWHSWIREAIDAGLVDHSGQGRDVYGR